MSYFFEPDDIELRKKDIHANTNLGSPDILPGFFDGVMGATGSAVWTGLAQSEGMLSDFVDTAAGYYIQKMDDMFGGSVRKDLQKHAKDSYQVARNLTPDPKTTGTAGQIIHGFLGMGVQAVAGSFVAGPLGAALLVGASQGTAEYDNLIEQGVDKTTARHMGLLTGTVSAAGVALPMSFGYKNVFKDVSLSVLANTSLGMGQRGFSSEVLEHAGYSDMAKQYKIMDGTAIATDVGLGLVFGGLGFKYANKMRKQQALKDALLAQSNALHAETDSSPGMAVNFSSREAHIRAMNKGLSDIAEGKSVDVTAILKDAEFLPKKETEFNLQAFETIKSHYSDIPLDAVRFNARTNSIAFSERIGRVAEYDKNGLPTFKNGTAYSIEEIVPFYEKFIKDLEPKKEANIPDVAFSIGKVDGVVETGLTKYLKGYHPGLSEIRIDGNTIKHIHDSRPTIAKDVLSRLGEGVLEADEVLPNHQNLDRALIVLKHIEENIGEEKAKHQVTVLEVRANGTGTDVITSMVSPDRSLKKAREMKKEIESRLEGQQLPPFGDNSPHLEASKTPSAAADFLQVNRDGSNVAQQNKNANPDVMLAQKVIGDNPNLLVNYVDDNGVTHTMKASELLKQMDNELNAVKKDSKLYDIAATCLFGKGK